MCICSWQKGTPLVSIFCRTWTVKFWERSQYSKHLPPRTVYFPFSLQSHVGLIWSQCSSQCSLGMRTKKLFLESADVGSQPIRPPSSCEALSLAWFFFSQKWQGWIWWSPRSLLFLFSLVLILPKIFQFLWNSLQKVVSDSSKYFLWFELKKTK